MEQPMKIELFGQKAKSLTIISAKGHDGNTLTTKQIKLDWGKLKEAHEKALTSEPTWQFFGGILTVNGHTYQVC
jgi:hypothetical protein